MTLGGWILMLSSWAVLSWLLVFCYSRAFRLKVDPDEVHKQSL
jgi:cation transporter-like permease